MGVKRERYAENRNEAAKVGLGVLERAGLAGIQRCRKAASNRKLN